MTQPRALSGKQVLYLHRLLWAIQEQARLGVPLAFNLKRVGPLDQMPVHPEDFGARSTSGLSDDLTGNPTKDERCWCGHLKRWHHWMGICRWCAKLELRRPQINYMPRHPFSVRIPDKLRNTPDILIP